MAADEMTVSESATLERLEKTVATGISSFLEVGNALAEIRDKKLYRARHKTFEAYCQERWNIGRRQAHNLIGAAEVVTNLGSALPKNDSGAPSSIRQAKPLARLPKTEQAEAWTEATKTSPAGKPTGKHVEKVVARRLAEKSPEPPPAPAPRKQSAADHWIARIDAVKEAILEEVADRGPNNHSRAVLRALDEAIGQIRYLNRFWSTQS